MLISSGWVSTLLIELPPDDHAYSTSKSIKIAQDWLVLKNNNNDNDYDKNLANDYPGECCNGNNARSKED